jgi:methylated-DNA-[protein]-cysteine S-methyltransferase
MTPIDSIHAQIVSPLGALLVTSDGDALTSVRFAEHAHMAPLSASSRQDAHAAPLAEAARQLAAYFANELHSFALPLAPRGSEFQRKVWAALAEIPFGATSSYGALARRLGAPNHLRAVGHANARNPLSILVPCHRVVGASGALTGYAGGVWRKRWLLEHESALQPGLSGKA